ncbi:glycosyltransferase family 4 protein [Novosphingobium album (ex Liu et al. 2023)]|uniref:Glycosyltransferase family 4 protein n=1 Tax=Novosphingobium album (ex Liu et al. 2023) TaxID=3031130 RepID=A0ABT5WKA8_9SPHN|nr:glycosyltransferase family 4 protein [Novosphingobium album (ex Liu et al. 2023)]MDE8650461.1 glycosyltransferase family 4 protein [Novosphingobium album (ex Liu et al. 2023)]
MEFERLRPERITVFATGTEGYGIRRCLVAMAEGLAARGVAVHFAALSGTGRLADVLKQRQWPATVFAEGPPRSVSGGGLGKLVGIGSRGGAQIAAARRLARCVRETGSEAILLCSPLETLAASAAARMTGVKAFWMVPNEINSGYPLDLNKRLYRALFRHGNLVPLANSRFTDASLGPGAFQRHVCHLGIDPAEFDPALDGNRTRAGLGIPDEAVVIGLFARMVENKGQLQMLRAIATLGGKARDVHLLLCGGPMDTPYVAKLREEAAAHGIADRIHLMGEQNDMLGFYQVSDIVANSRLDPEPFGLSVIEGMMLGKPVLAHRAGGPAETVVDGKTGWLIPSPDLEAFTAALERVLADRPRWPDMSAQARAHALAHFTAAHMVERVLAVMRQNLHAVTARVDLPGEGGR